ncbi:response regulator [Flavobacterium sp.]|uniref:response regulator n=1 Tax=Flavobacterium sp. TaxID=239 RepID=UPI0012049F7E|nr:response regulator [Flavobacterium sp.]RZJ73682.1 MAG: response regulator [Flavobacterium sp.]
MIFYADDDLDDLDFFTEAASMLGRKVKTFTLGDDLIDQLKNPPPKAAIIFLDINMPKKSGLQILKEIRSAELWNKLPIVMLSTAKEQAMIESSKGSGANLFITKSANFEKFTQNLKRALDTNFSSHPNPQQFYFA